MTNKKMYKKLKKKLRGVHKRLLALQDFPYDTLPFPENFEETDCCGGMSENAKDFLLINNVSDERAAQITTAMLKKHCEFSCHRAVNSDGEGCYGFIITGKENIEIYSEIMSDLPVTAGNE